MGGVWSGDTLVPVARLPKLHAIHSLTLFLVRSRRSMEALNCTKDASALRARGHARKTPARARQPVLAHHARRCDAVF